MKVLILSNSDEGIYRFRKELLIDLIKKKHEVYVSVFNGKYVEKIKELGCNYVPISFNRKGTNPLSDLKLLNQYKKILDEIKPDIVLTYTIKPNIYGNIACRSKGIPCISTITGLGSAIENGGILQKVSLALYKIAFSSVKKVFFQNETNMNFMTQKNIISKDKTVLVSGSGVNLEEYKLLDYPKKETIDFAYIGRVMKEKGFDQYIDAAKYIRNKYNNTRFHICGMYEDDYKDLIEELEKENIVIYHGNVTDMINNVYKVIDCTIHPSYYAEGMSNVLLETCASGRAIITTDRPGCKEIVDDGINGYIVKQKDTNDLIEKIEKYLNLSYEQRKQLGLNARLKVEKQFDRKIVINRYIEEIEKYGK